MPKYLKTLILVFFIALPVYSFAKNANAGQDGQGQGDRQQVQDPSTHEDGETYPQGQGQGSQRTGASYQNQVQTQNTGEDQQLQVSTQQEASGELARGKVLKINEKASEVSKHVQNLLNMPDRSGGIGQQVKEVAKAQNQSQIKVMEKVQKMEQRGTLARFLFGSKSEDMDALREEMKQNQARAQTLKDLKVGLIDSVDQEAVQALIDSLMVQDVALTKKILDEESAFSLFGALKALFSK